MFPTSADWLVIVIDVSIKSLFLAVVAFLMLKLLKIRDSGVRHHIWAGVLCAMLTLPVVAKVVPAIPMPVLVDTAWLNSLSEAPANMAENAELARPTETASIGISSNDVAVASNDLVLKYAGQPWPSGTGEAMLEAQEYAVPMEETEFMSEAVVLEPVKQNTAPGDETAVATELTGSLSIHILRWLTITISVIWLVGVSCLLLRLLFGLFATNSIVRRARLAGVNPPTVGAGVRESSEIRVPVTVGLFRPAILLPVDWKEWSAEKLEAVMTHERTHVERRDFVFAVLAELNCCLYWFHPLSWWLRTRLSDLAEEACDDAAIGLTGDPAGYAKHLLEVAASLSQGEGRVCQPGLSMARKSNVEGRIHTILDFTRPLSARLTWKATVLILAVMLPFIGVTAALRPGMPVGDETSLVAANDDSATLDIKATPATDQGEGEVSSILTDLFPSAEAVGPPELIVVAEALDEAASDAHKPDAIPNESPAKRPLHIHGRVVNVQGKGIGDAQVRLYRTQGRDFYSVNDQSILVEVLQVDADGRFNQSIARDVLPVEDGDAQWSRKDWLMLVISAPSHVYATRSFPKYGETEPLNVALRNDVAIKGKLLGLEGQALAGIRVQPTACSIADTKKLDDWLNTAITTALKQPSSQGDKKKTNEKPSTNQPPRFPIKRDLKLPREAVPFVVTDADGEFELRGFSPDHLVELRISGENVVQTDIEVLGRQIDKTGSEREDAFQSRRFGEIYGNDFLHLARPGAAVFGIIRDVDSQLPLEGIRVGATQMVGSPYTQYGYLSAVTDAEGRYRLEGMPVVSRNSRKVNHLGVFPGPQPYILNTDIGIPRSQNSKAVEFNMELKKGLLAKGRLVDHKTDEAVTGKVYYSPFRGNPHIADFRRYADGITTVIGNGSAYRTNENGEFAIPVIPGRGVICAKVDGGAYVTSFGASDIPEFAAGTIRDGNTVCSDGIILNSFHSLKALDVAADAAEHLVDLPVTKGRSLTLRFMDEHNRPLQGIHCFGLSTIPEWKTVEGAAATMTGVETGQVRPFFFTHDQPSRKRIGAITFDKMATEHTIQLLPMAKIEGRLLDQDGQPLQGIAVAGDYRTNPESGSSINPDSRSDDNGRFKIWLPVGTEFHLVAKNEQITIGRIELTKPVNVDYGELTVDRKATGWTTAKAKSPPTITVRIQNAGIQHPEVAATNQSQHRGSTSGPMSGPSQKIKTSGPQLNNAAANSQPSGQTPVEAREDLTITGTVTVDAGSPPVVEVLVRRVFPRTAYMAPLKSKLISTTNVVPGEQFTVTIPGRLLPKKMSRQEGWLTVQATADGCGLAAATIRETSAATGINLKLPVERLITGRILDMEGQPVSGATVQISNAIANESKSMTTWLAAVAKQPRQPKPGTMLNIVSAFDMEDGNAVPRVRGVDLEVPFETFAAVTTDDTGKFALTGVGSDQLLQVNVTGPRIVSTIIPVIARPLSLKDTKSALHIGGENYYGSEFDFVAAPSAPITGIVRDKDTKLPIAGVTVAVEGVAGSPMSMFGSIMVQTDGDGRYRLEGLPTATDSKRHPNRITVIAKSQPYVSTSFRLPSSHDSEPIEFHPELRKAVLATGQLTDQKTGQPLQGSFYYTPFSGNPSNTNYKRYSDESRRLLGNDRTFVTDVDGRFQIPVISGRGVIGAICNDNRYRRAVGVKDIPEFAGLLKPKGQQLGLDYMTNDFITPLGMHVVKAIDVPTDTEIFDINLQADRGKSVRLHIAISNKDGGTVSKKLWIQGATARHRGTVTTDKSLIEVTGLDEGESRRIYVHDKERTVGRVADVTAKNKDMNIIVPPMLTVKGQLIGVNKTPLKQRKVTAVVPGSQLYQVVKATQTDNNGFFKLKVPFGGPYDIMTEIKPSTRNKQPVTVKSGLMLTKVEYLRESLTVDIGVVGLREPSTEAATEKLDVGEKQTATSSDASSQSVTVAGRVADEDDQPIGGATVYVPFYKTLPMTSLSHIGYEKLTTTTDDGSFRIKLGSRHMPGNLSNVVVHKPGLAIDWIDIKRDEPKVSHQLTLRPERTIRGTLLTTEGQPIVGAKVSPTTIMKPKQETLDEFLAMFKNDWNLAPSQSTHRLFISNRMLFGNPTTDESGNFKIRGVAAEQVCSTDFEAPEHATTAVWLVNREDFEAAPFNKHTREYPGMTVPLLAAPDETQVLEFDLTIAGRVTDDQGTPIVDAVLQGLAGWGNAVVVRTDDEGRYELKGLSHQEQLVVVALLGAMSKPTTDVFLGQTISVKPNSTDRRITQDFQLKKGIVVTGKVIDPLTGEGVQSSLKSHPVKGNTFADVPGYDKSKRDGTTRQSNPDGTFRLVTIPGPQVLMVQADGQKVDIGTDRRNPFRQAVFSEADSKFVETVASGDDRFFYSGANRVRFLHDQNAVRYLNPSQDSPPLDVTVQLDRGKTVDVQFVDETGKSVNGVFLSGVTDMSWITARSSQASVTIYGLGEDRPRQLVCLQAARHLAATVNLQSNEASPLTVVLKKASTIRGRAVDEDGEPLVDRLVFTNFRGRTADELYRFHDMDRVPQKTNSDGEFEIPLVVPSVRFILDIRKTASESYLRARLTSEQREVRAGSDLNLGDVTFASPETAKK